MAVQIGDTIQDGTVVWLVTDASGVVYATPDKAGIMKLYGTSGNNTDGTISQAGIAALLNDKLSTSAKAASASTADTATTSTTATTANNIPTSAGRGNIWIA